MCQKLSEWASQQLGMSDQHPAGTDSNDQPRKDLWPPPEGTAPPPPEEDNPLVKLLIDVGNTQKDLLDDYILLTNRINIHRCSAFCLQS